MEVRMTDDALRQDVSSASPAFACVFGNRKDVGKMGQWWKSMESWGFLKCGFWFPALSFQAVIQSRQTLQPLSVQRKSSSQIRIISFVSSILLLSI